MPRQRTARSRNATPRRRPNGGVPSITSATGPVAPYASDPRWSTPARRRTDVFVVDISDRSQSSTQSDDALALTA